jgi:uncharacterized Tic20 family protein
METSTSSRDVRTWNVLCHATALAGFFVPWAGHILGPLIVWLAKRSDSPEIDENGKESLNFQISMLIYNVIAGVLCLLLIGFIILAILHILNLVLVIVASIQASEGKFYRYPMTIRLSKALPRRPERGRGIPVELLSASAAGFFDSTSLRSE